MGADEANQKENASMQRERLLESPRKGKQHSTSYRERTAAPSACWSTLVSRAPLR